jgi:hypothetical protein
MQQEFPVQGPLMPSIMSQKERPSPCQVPRIMRSPGSPMEEFHTRVMHLDDAPPSSIHALP